MLRERGQPGHGRYHRGDCTAHPQGHQRNGQGAAGSADQGKAQAAEQRGIGFHLLSVHGGKSIRGSFIFRL